MPSACAGLQAPIRSSPAPILSGSQATAMLMPSSWAPIRNGCTASWSVLSSSLKRDLTLCPHQENNEKGASCFMLRAHPDSNQGPADLQPAALTTELCTQTMHF